MDLSRSHDDRRKRYPLPFSPFAKSVVRVHLVGRIGKYRRERAGTFTLRARSPVIEKLGVPRDMILFWRIYSIRGNFSFITRKRLAGRNRNCRRNFSANNAAPWTIENRSALLSRRSAIEMTDFKINISIVLYPLESSLFPPNFS